MRFDELTLGPADEEVRIRFHERLTVLCGLAPDERQAFIDNLIAALTGNGDAVALTCVDATGQVVSPGARAATETDRLRRLMVLGAPPRARRERAAETPELAEARDTLDALGAELERARAAREALVRLEDEAEAVERQVLDAREAEARREYALVLAELERTRAEAATLEGGDAGAEADWELLDGVADIGPLAELWSSAHQRVRALDGSYEPLADTEHFGQLARIPAGPPAALRARLAAWDLARTRVVALERRLQEMAAAELPEPSDPLVAELAALDQRTLEQRRTRLDRATDELREAQISLGGLDVDLATPPRAVARIEAAHAALESAEQVAGASRRRSVVAAVALTAGGVVGLAVTPLVAVAGGLGAAGALAAGLLAPARRVGAARRAEQLVLEEVGAATYLAFHLRRVDATIDPGLRSQLDRAIAEHRAAAAEWMELVGGEVTVERANALDAEVGSYHRALRELGGAAEEIAELRVRIRTHAAPALAHARAVLDRTCRAYAIDPATLDRSSPGEIERLVTERVDAGARARVALELLHARLEEDELASELDRSLVGLGFAEGDLHERVAALARAEAAALGRERARARARPLDEVRAELDRLGARAAALHRPGWSDVTPPAADAADPEALEARLAAIRARLDEAGRTGPGGADIERLTDRHAAVARRVAALEARDGTDDPEMVRDLHDRIAAFLTAAATAGPDHDPLPVVFDEPLAAVPAERRWDLLDLLLRLSERHQIVYLSDDGFVAAWARCRMPDGGVRLLEQEPDPVSQLA